MAAIVNFFKSISPFKSAEPEEEPAPAKKSAKKPAAKKPAAKKAPAKKKARFAASPVTLSLIHI